MATELEYFSTIFSEKRLPLFRIMLPARRGRRAGMNQERSSGLISSLFVAADVANDIGDVLVAFLLVGDEGGIIVIIVFDGFVDLDIVFRFGNDGLDLAGFLLGIGLFPRDQFLGLGGLRHIGGGGPRCGGGPRRTPPGGPRRRGPAHTRPIAR